jgi:Protein phosphatase 2C
MTWVAAADFRRAKDDNPRSHPCLVYGKVEHLDDRIMIGAVASGAAQAKLSHLGARLAVRTALNHLRHDGAIAGDALSDSTGERARSLYVAMLDAISGQLRRAVVDHVAPLQEFATTLTVFVAKPTGVAAMQIGGGIVVSRRQNGDYSLLFSEGAGTQEAEPGFITDHDQADRMRVSVEDGPVAFLCAASAPLDRLSVRRKDGAPQKEFFRPLDRYASTAPDDVEVHRGIRTFLRSDRVHGRLDQDVALALCGYRRQGELFRPRVA